MASGNQTQLAAYLGINKGTVSRAVRAGRLQPEADGSFDFEKSAARWHDTAGGRADVAARHAAQRGSAIPESGRAKKNAPKAQETGFAEDDALPGDPASSSRTQAKALLLHYENATIKLEMALRRGQRLEVSAVRSEAAGLGSMLRAGIERIIDQTAPRLAATGDASERRRILDTEIKRLAWIVKREMPCALRRMKQASAGKGGPQ